MYFIDRISQDLASKMYKSRSYLSTKKPTACNIPHCSNAVKMKFRVLTLTLIN